jgi:hypothetical protein
MIATTTFTAAYAVDEALEHLRFGHGAEQHDGLAGRALRHGGIRAVPDDPNGARPSLASTADIFVAFGHYIPLATIPHVPGVLASLQRMLDAVDVAEAEAGWAGALSTGASVLITR